MNLSVTQDNSLKSLLPDPVIGSQSAVQQSKNMQLLLQQPVANKLEVNSNIVNTNTFVAPSSAPVVAQKPAPVKSKKSSKKRSLKNMKNMLRKQNKKVLVNLICMVLVILGALNWGAHVFDINLVQIIDNLLNDLVTALTGEKLNIKFNIIVYSMVFSAAIILARQKTFWLSFLGPSVLPSSLVPLRKPSKSDIVVNIKTKPNSKVAYWSALPNNSKDVPFVTEAYGDFSNSGVVMSNDKGEASLSLLSGTKYVVPSGKEISRHLHWRLINENGMMGPVNTWKY